ncbi:HAD-IC family P-type ATPase [Chamaesiphon minutus]|uniref:HAD-IC family P-type ATPase n=1 Tax=Chamaesiphon minutus TaxID=1173032 RepID=UPI00031A6CC7|nr:HAD-IC family P-type ATPase [Chamaesiphon minutus]
MNALIALTTGTTYLYSLVSTFAPQTIAGNNPSQPPVYYSISTMTITLIFVGRKLEYLAKKRSQAAISKLIHRQFPYVSTPLLDRSLALVDRLQVNKLPIPRLVDRVTNRYIVPIILSLAIVTSLLWSISLHNPTSGIVFGWSILTITCPCTLGLATSLAMAIGINKAAQREILVNNSNALELLSQVNTIVFDKNATIVSDRLTVTDFIPIVDNYHGTELDIFQLVASLEVCTKNLLASAIVDRAKELALELKPVELFQEIAGNGIQGIVDGKLIQIGSNEWISSLDIDNVLQVANQRVLTNYQHQWESTGKTVIWIAIDREIAGIIGISAAIAPSAISTISRLKRVGLEVVLIATDNLATTANLADRLRIERVFACKNSQDKVTVVQKLQSRSIGNYRAIVAMVGTDIHDAPALAQADVSMAIGKTGNLATSFNDLTLFTSDLQAIITARKLSRSTLHKIEQNLFFTFIYNLICLPIAAGIFYLQFGLSLTPEIAIGAMGASLVSVVMNTWRSRKTMN